MPDVTKTTPPPRDAGLSRRGLLARAGLAGAAALGTGLIGDPSPARASTNRTAAFGPTGDQKRFAVNDVDILTFALNTEYFEAEFYLRAVNGEGLPTTLITGGLGYGPSPYKAVVPGNVTTYVSGTSATGTGTNTAVTFDDPTIMSFAQEIAQDESDHVTLLRKTLGKRAPARPALDLAGAFTAFMRLAGVIGATDTFDPFANQRNFLLAAFLINDIGPTAYVGATPYISSPDYLAAAAGILGTESYHAGETRTLLFALSQEQADDSYLTQAGAIANLRNNVALLGGSPNPTDAGIVDADGLALLVPADDDAIVYARTFSSILTLLYQNTTTASQTPPPGGFLPSGFNGRIR
jgi:hypothetical protein